MRYDTNTLMNSEKIGETMIAGDALMTETEAMLESDGLKDSPVVSLYRKALSIRNSRSLDTDDQALLFALGVSVLDAGKRPATAQQYLRETIKVIGELHRYLDLLRSKLSPEAAAGLPTVSGAAVLFIDRERYDGAALLSKLSGSKRNDRVYSAKAFLQAAVTRGILASSPIEHWEGQKIKSRARAVTDDQLRQAWEAAVHTLEGACGWWFTAALRDLILLALKSVGARSCELADSNREDLAQSGSDEFFISNSKSEEGVRWVGVPQWVMAAIALYVRQVDQHLAAVGWAPFVPSDPLFVGLRKGRMSSGAVSGRISALLPAGVRPHQLRTRVGTDLTRHLPLADVAGVMGIDVSSLKPYMAPRDTAAAKAATATLVPSHDIDRISALLDLPADLSRPESECWLPDEFDDLDEPLRGPVHLRLRARAEG